MPLTCVVTGANRGLGLELARQLSTRGESVIATARRPDRAEELRRLDVRVEKLDVADAASIASLAKRLDGGSLDLLINNAGRGGGRGSFEDEDWDDVARFFQVNTLGPARVSQALLPNLRQGTAKKIVNVTSRMGSIDDNTSGDAYGYRASKTALNMITRSMAVDLRREGFTCVVLHPGWVATDMGGAGAPLSAPESVAGMLKVIDGLRPSRTGSFFDFSGAVIPW